MALPEVDPDGPPRRLAVYSAGFLRQKRLRQILSLTGWKIELGVISGKSDAVGVWGRRPVSSRGIRAALSHDLPVLTVEDAFLRSVRPGPEGDPPLGLLLDLEGVHFDCSTPNRLERLLADGDLDDPNLLTRARNGIALLREARLSKYNAFEGAPKPETGYVLVIDQTRADASITHGASGRRDFGRMLARAKSDHPDRRILIRTHPVTESGHKRGHFGPGDLDDRTAFAPQGLDPWSLLEEASAVYTVTSQMGFEAILAGHTPVVIGQPFYMGWGLSEDVQVNPRRGRIRTVEQLFAAAMLLYPVWFDPVGQRLCSFEDTVHTLIAQRRARAEDRCGWQAFGMSRWKQPGLARFLGGNVSFPDASRQIDRPAVVWARKETPQLVDACLASGQPLYRMEDGFLRSVGLGAELRPALSLVLDDLGIYFDPARPSRLEALIEASVTLSSQQLARAEALRRLILSAGLTKYNLKGRSLDLPPADGHVRILVPGQVADDASVLLGCPDVSTNADLLAHVRAQNPDAQIIYKPHPDVEAGLRKGAIAADAHADVVAAKADMQALLEAVDEVWTMSSLAGFEALLRGKAVHCLGQPFYAGWGLTQDHAPKIKRRMARPKLAALVHATLIDYPRYFDPASGEAASPEQIVRILATGQMTALGGRLRLLSLLQYRFRRFAHMWRG